MDLAVQQKLAIGYGIVTVNTMEQAEARAFIDRGDKGGDAAPPPDHDAAAPAALALGGTLRLP